MVTRFKRVICMLFLSLQPRCYFRAADAIQPDDVLGIINALAASMRELAKPWCANPTDIKEMVFPVLFTHESNTRGDDETPRDFKERMHDVVRSTAHHAAVAIEDELAAAYQVERGGVASTGDRLELVFVHGLAVLKWARQPQACGTGRGGEARVRSSTVQQTLQQLRGDAVGALVSDQRVEPVQDADRAQLVDVICAQVCHLNEEMRTALRLRLLQQELVCVSLEAVAGGSDKDGGGSSVPVEPRNWTPPSTSATWFSSEVYRAMLCHDGDLLLARTAAQAGTWPGVWVDLLMLLRALYVEQCTLNGIFWDRAADGSAEQTAGVSTVVQHAHCANGKLPWMQVNSLSNGTGRRPIAACKVVIAGAVLGGLTAAKPVSTHARFRVTGALDIRPAAAPLGSGVSGSEPVNDTAPPHRAPLQVSSVNSAETISRSQKRKAPSAGKSEGGFEALPERCGSFDDSRCPIGARIAQ
ncbi:hypothetical protein JKP88DRAFT_307480 [Tribonema minus]|uniref:Uncharacterized protein n=1 Tax=Tribonema minus TaxID=303371 RepID=A0A836CII0_9STRA|nr:hypothetical protein JKP88DRAFT_307480 [Tribonema minus]